MGQPLLSWRERAACRRVDQRIFYEDDQRAKARRCCSGCPVRLDCLEAALTEEPRGLSNRFGVRGGLSPLEREGLMHETMALYRS